MEDHLIDFLGSIYVFMFVCTVLDVLEVFSSVKPKKKKIFSFVSSVNLNYEQMYFEFLLKNVVLLINKGVASFSA